MSAAVAFIEREKSLVAHIGRDIDHHTAGGIREAIDSRMFFRRPDELASQEEEVPEEA